MFEELLPAKNGHGKHTEWSKILQMAMMVEIVVRMENGQGEAVKGERHIKHFNFKLCINRQLVTR